MRRKINNLPAPPTTTTTAPRNLTSSKNLRENENRNNRSNPTTTANWNIIAGHEAAEVISGAIKSIACWMNVDINSEKWLWAETKNVKQSTAQHSTAQRMTTEKPWRGSYDDFDKCSIDSYLCISPVSNPIVYYAECLYNIQHAHNIT